MILRIISSALFLAYSSSHASPSSTGSNSTVVYHIKGAASQADAAISRIAVKRLQEVLTQAALHRKPVQVFLSGVFLLDAPLILASGNARTVLSGEGAQAAVLLPQRPMFATLQIDRASGVTIRNLKISGSSRNGVYAKDSPSITITNMLVVRTASNGWSQGAIHLTGTAKGARIGDNTIEHSGFGGIVVDTTSNSDVSDVRITNNKVTDSCNKVDDCGAIYINDRGRRSTSIEISGNRVTGFGGTKINARAIYLDDWASDVSVRNNIINGPGSYAFQIHGGRNNRIIRNTVNLKGIREVLRYGRATDGSAADMSDNMMADNTFFVGDRNPSLQFSNDYRTSVGKISFARNRLCKATSCRIIH